MGANQVTDQAPIKKLYKPERDKLLKFDSIEEYCDYLRAIPEHITQPWGNTYNLSSIINNLANGTTEYVSQAEKILDKMQEQNLFSVGMPMLESSVMGFMPNVPAALAGHPKHMVSRFMSDARGINTPLNIYMEPGVSGGMSNQQVINRGISVLAFVMAMSNIRPVELYIAETNSTDMTATNPNCFGAAVKITTRPLDLARACWAFTNVNYVSPIGFITSADLYHKTTGKKTNWCGWSWGGKPQNLDYQLAIREIYDMQPDDVFIWGGHLFDSLMLNDPVEWVRQMISRHSGATSEAG